MQDKEFQNFLQKNINLIQLHKFITMCLGHVTKLFYH